MLAAGGTAGGTAALGWGGGGTSCWLLTSEARLGRCTGDTCEQKAEGNGKPRDSMTSRGHAQERGCLESRQQQLCEQVYGGEGPWTWRNARGQKDGRGWAGEEGSGEELSAPSKVKSLRGKQFPTIP